MNLEPNTFPIDRHLDEITSELETSNTILIKAETGAGKTTRLPPFLAQKKLGNILVLEPRRLAAKLSAKRCADVLGTEIGKRVGHHIRFDKKVSNETELLFITEGLFLHYLREDKDLSNYSVVVIDEFHERNIHTDVALSLVRHLQNTTRPDLKLIIMSATLDTEKLEDYLDSPSTFDISGRTFPITIEYQDLYPEVAVENMLKDNRCTKNILVFLPGMGAIRRLEQQLKSLESEELEIIPLHSTLSKKDQDRAFKGSKRKVILSTNIAETSLTIPNITGVIDTGTERRASFAPWSGMPLLQLEKVSKASATQRAGRAGRIEEGLVYRLYKEADYIQRPPFTPPEVKRVELSHYILDLLSLGIGPRDLNWFETPEEKNVDRAYQLLTTLGAIENDIITPMGSFMATLPLHPRLGAMLYNSIDEDILLAASILNEGNVYSKNVEFRQDDNDYCDLSIQMDLVKANFYKEKNLCDYSKSFLELKKYKRVIELYSSLSKKFKLGQSPINKKTNPKSLTMALLAGFPDRVAGKRQAKQKGRKVESFNFCLGRGGKIARSSILSSNDTPFIIVLDALEDPKANAAIGTSIQTASRVLLDDLTSSNSSLIKEEKETSFNEKKGSLIITDHLRYGKLTLKSHAHPPVMPKGENLIQLMKENWPWPFENDEELKLFNKKVYLLNTANIENQCPEFTGEMFDLFIESCVDEHTTYCDLLEKGLEKLIDEQLSPQDQYVLASETPSTLKLENGKSFKIYYDEEIPYIRARIQDLYSTGKHPILCKNNLVIKLLSPADRVAGIISDIPSFWESSWEAVRKDLKSRYPKHFWPTDPLNSPAQRIKPKS